MGCYGLCGFSARAGLRMTCLDLELENWDLVQKRDRLLGCSVTGWQDAMNAVGYGASDQAKLLRTLREAVHSAGSGYAKELGINEPMLMTTVKPEGTLSQLPEVSSGVHFFPFGNTTSGGFEFLQTIPWQR